MWFLIRTAFWFAVVLMLLPAADPASKPRDGAQPTIDVGATVDAAASALGDLTGLCRRRPEVCETGGRTLSALGARARDGARLAVRMIDERTAASDGTVSSDGVLTGTVRPGSAEKPAETAAAVPVPMPAPARPSAFEAPADQPAYLPRPYSPPIP